MQGSESGIQVQRWSYHVLRLGHWHYKQPCAMRFYQMEPRGSYFLTCRAQADHDSLILAGPAHVEHSVNCLLGHTTETSQML